MTTQVFGLKSDSETRKALRFFKERRIPVHFIDFKIKSPSVGELRRFSQKFGIDAMINRKTKRFKALGLTSAHYGEDRWLELAAEEPLILVTPLVRSDHGVTVGAAEAVWRHWTSAAGADQPPG